MEPASEPLELQHRAPGDGQTASGLVALLALLALIVLLPSTASARPTGVEASVSGFSLSGPLTDVTLCTKYSYRVQIVSPQSYKAASVSFVVSPYRTMKRVSLVAHQPWHGVFTAEFTTTNSLSEGIDVAVIVLPPHRGYKRLFSNTYAVTAAASQPITPPEFCGEAPPPSFGS